ncbi:MAG: rod shape-determining protein RodA [Chloroflexota bacterium]|nr:rod shape-determining protein RodA [Chloroflexota bacterium]
MERLARPRFPDFDLWLLGATLLLALIGIAMIYSATACITGEPLDWQSPALRQALYLGIGLVGMFAIAFIDYRAYGALRWLIWVFTLGILAVVSVIGQMTHGAQRWIDLRIFLFQPSELSKLLLILVVAKYMADHELEMTKWRVLAVSFLFVALPLALVYLQPDLGTAIVLAATWGVMALAAGMKMRDVLIIAAIGLIAAPLIWSNLRQYQQERILTFLDPARDPLGAGYNVTQARIAIGSGGLYGLGFCSGTQSQLRFLRIRQTDFIFSVIGEELGFIGALFVLALIAFILFRIIRAAMLARTTYGKLIALGVTAVIFVQSSVNLGMNLGLMPVTGIPLPFVSSGGSSLISLLAAEGVVQSILMRHSGLELAGSGKKYR